MKEDGEHEPGVQTGVTSSTLPVAEGKGEAGKGEVRWACGIRQEREGVRQVNIAWVTRGA